jgi:Helix-turn-helix domain
LAERKSALPASGKAARDVVRTQRISLQSLSDDEFVGSDIAARILNLAPMTLQTWRCRKCGPAFYKIGRLAYYRVADLAAWLAKQRQEPTAI